MSLLSIADLFNSGEDSGLKYAISYDELHEILTISNAGKKTFSEDMLREKLAEYKTKVTKVILDCKAPKVCTCLFKGFVWLKEVVCTANWDTTDTHTFTGMFSDCLRLEKVDGATWNVSNARSFTDMFRNCKKLSRIDLTNWDVSGKATIENMFSGCDNLTSIGQPK